VAAVKVKKNKKSLSIGELEGESDGEHAWKPFQIPIAYLFLAQFTCVEPHCIDVRMFDRDGDRCGC